MKKVFLILFLLIFMALSACSPSPVGDPISSVDTQIEITPISPAEEPGETGYPVVPEPVAPIYAYPVSIEIDDLPIEQLNNVKDYIIQALNCGAVSADYIIPLETLLENIKDTEKSE